MIELWHKARKRPVEIAYRDVIPNGYLIKDGYGIMPNGWRELGDNYPVDEGFGRIYCERIETLEGIHFAFPGIDYVIKGIIGELYPIKIEIFNKTYDTIND